MILESCLTLGVLLRLKSSLVFEVKRADWLLFFPREMKTAIGVKRKVAAQTTCEENKIAKTC